jgi:hypothetical protein
MQFLVYKYSRDAEALESTDFVFAQPVWATLGLEDDLDELLHA